MKPSTKSSSPKRKVLPLRREVFIGGLAFAPPKEAREAAARKGFTIFKGLDAWYDAKSPTNSLIYDQAGALVDVGIPIIDAAYAQGLYFRCAVMGLPVNMKVPPRGLTSAYAVPHTDEDHIVLSPDGIMTITPEATAKASGLGKMSRGAGHRSKKGKK